MSSLRAPKPNIGTCEKTGMWDNSTMVSDCQECVSQPGYYGEKQFYCSGNCMSQYSMNAICSVADLVAKNKQQCLSPCVQVKHPSLSNGCADDFDCNNNQVCQKGICVTKENFTMGIL
jgi:hypothetical protein